MICLITGVRIKVKGLEGIDGRKPAIYVANHASHLDILAISRIMPIGLFYIGKKELAYYPILGQYMKLIGHIFVDRKNRELAMESMRMAAEKIKNGKSIISYPEGTRSKTGEMNVFKRGSFIIAKEGKIDVVPIAIRGSREALQSGSYSIRPGIIEVIIGERISSDMYTHLSAEEIASLAQERVRNLMLQPTIK